MFYFDGESYFVLTNQIEKVREWLKITNEKVNTPPPVIWDGYQSRGTLIALSHGSLDGRVEFYNGLYTTEEIAKKCGDQLIKQGVDKLFILCCHSALVRPVRYKTLEIRPLILSPFQMMFQEGYVLLPDMRKEYAVKVSVRKANNKYINKIKMAISFWYGKLAAKQKPKVVEIKED